MVLATKSSSPMPTKTNAIRMVISELLNGSFDTGFPLANQSLMNFVGNILTLIVKISSISKSYKYLNLAKV